MNTKILVSTLAMAFSLSACMGVGGGGSEVNRSVNSVHQPIVSIASYVIDADASSGMLAPAEMRRVADWLDAMDVAYGDRISVDESSAYNSRAARDAVAMLIARKGLMLSENAPITEGNIQAGSIRVVITRSTARVPGCPDWTTNTATDFQRTTTSNYGCATNANIAAMVADASDLVRGQHDESNDPLTASRAIRSYRARAGGGGAAPAAPAMPGLPGMPAPAAPGGGQ